jgi:nicotinate-nucleotide adenylyltransferase
VNAQGGRIAARNATGIPRLPRHGRGMCIGLMGGSFNPPHDGHRMLSLTAMKRLGLDRVWWLVTPGNPLKDNRNLPPLADRIRLCQAIANHPRIDISDAEATMDIRYTHDTVSRLKRMCPGVRFVWLMGADNLAGFHRWQNWRGIVSTFPFAVIDRPGSTLKAMRARAATVLAGFRLHEAHARALAQTRPPAWLFLHGRRSVLSSTLLRQRMQAKPQAR